MMPPLKRTDRSRNLILDAAEVAFRQNSFANVSVEEIAQRAGLTRQTVYNLFASKEEIVSQLVIRAEAKPAAAFRARMAANEAALVLLEDALLGSARWCLANPTVALFALAGPAAGPSTTPPPGRPSFQLLIRDLLLLGQRQRVIRRDEDPNIMALVLLGSYAQAMVHGLADGSLLEKKLKYLLRLLVEGFGERRAPAGKARPKRAKKPGPKTAARRKP
jgi:TetR/AcrR family transcriptional regulator, regulator of autoinduction and epiphytic fitness